MSLEPFNVNPGGVDVPPDVFDRQWRVGVSWGVTVVALGVGELDRQGRRVGDVLIAVAMRADVAKHIVSLHNAARRAALMLIGAAEKAETEARRTSDQHLLEYADGVRDAARFLLDEAASEQLIDFLARWGS